MGASPGGSTWPSSGLGGQQTSPRVGPLHLDLVAAAGHRAPPGRAVARAVVERPPARVPRADLDPRPAAARARLAHGLEQPRARARPGAFVARAEPQLAGAVEARPDRDLGERRR